MNPLVTARVRLAAVLLAMSATLFIAYPVLRPYSSETGIAGARAFSSDRWVLAHACSMIAFAGLAAATLALGVGAHVQHVTLLGVALILPYYGAEAFGLHAIGQAALRRGDPSLVTVVNMVRDNPVALLLFGAGWIALALAGVLFARAAQSSTRIGAALVGAGLVLYLPQFYGPPWVRIAHGVLLAAGLLLLACQTVINGQPRWGTLPPRIGGQSPISRLTNLRGQHTGRRGGD